MCPPPPPADNGVPQAGGLASGEFDRLVALARDRSAQARRELVETVSDLFFQRGQVLSGRERALITEILEQLVREVELPVRRHLAERLAEVPHAPQRLIISLANDEIDVARSVLIRSVVLQDLDLIEVIRHRTLAHQLAVAVREPALSALVSDALVETGEVDVIASLLTNKNAEISTATIAYIAERAKYEEKYQGPLLHRSDLDPGLAKKLYWWVSAALRRTILEQFQIDPMELDDQLEATVHDLVEDARGDASPQKKAELLARRLAETQALTPTLMVQVLRQGEIILFEALFTEMTQLRPTLARRLLYEPGGEGLAIVSRALGMEKPTFASVFLLSRRARPGDQTVDPMELSRALAFFDGLDAKAAERMVKRWRRDPQFLEAMWRVDSSDDGSGR